MATPSQHPSHHPTNFRKRPLHSLLHADHHRRLRPHRCRRPRPRPNSCISRTTQIFTRHPPTRPKRPPPPRHPGPPRSPHPYPIPSPLRCPQQDLPIQNLQSPHPRSLPRRACLAPAPSPFPTSHAPSRAPSHRPPRLLSFLHQPRLPSPRSHSHPLPPNHKSTCPTPHRNPSHSRRLPSSHDAKPSRNARRRRSPKTLPPTNPAPPRIKIPPPRSSDCPSSWPLPRKSSLPQTFHASSIQDLPLSTMKNTLPTHHWICRRYLHPDHAEKWIHTLPQPISSKSPTPTPPQPPAPESTSTHPPTALPMHSKKNTAAASCVCPHSPGPPIQPPPILLSAQLDALLSAPPRSSSITGNANSTPHNSSSSPTV